MILLSHPAPTDDKDPVDALVDRELAAIAEDVGLPVEVLRSGRRLGHRGAHARWRCAARLADLGLSYAEIAKALNANDRHSVYGWVRSWRERSGS